MSASLGITEPARVPRASPFRRLAVHPREFLIRTQAFGPALLVAAVLLFIIGPGVAALVFGLVLLVLTLGNDWSYTRLSAPLFAVLLLGGLERRTRPAIVICSAVAALGALVPFVLA